MSSRKRRRPDSPPASGTAQPLFVDACWYYAALGCTRHTCRFSHQPYRALLDAYTNQLPFAEDDKARQQWSSCRRFAAFFSESSLQAGQWVAVLPVPLISRATKAFDDVRFRSAMKAVMGGAGLVAADGAVSVLVDVRDFNKRVWGSVVLQGRRDEVERGREAFIWLMDMNYYRSHDTDLLRHIGYTMAQWRQSKVATPPHSPAAADGVNDQRDEDSNNGSLPIQHDEPPAVPAPAAPAAPAYVESSSSAATSRGPLPPQGPCVLHMIRGVCDHVARCLDLHDPYPCTVARLADTAPTSQHVRSKDHVTQLFLPLLAPLVSSSPVVYVVSLPLPCVPGYSALVMGRCAAHARFIHNYCALNECRFTHRGLTKAEQIKHAEAALLGRAWLAVRGEGALVNVDRLLELVFVLVDGLCGKRGYVSCDDTVGHLERHMKDWEKSRERSALDDGELFAFKSRTIPFRLSQAPFASSSTTSSSSSSASAAQQAPAASASDVAGDTSPTDRSTPSVALDVSAASPTSEATTPSGSLPVAALPSSPTAASTSVEVNVATQLAIQLGSMHLAGPTVTHSTLDALFDDYCLADSPQSVPFIRLLPTAQFACLPLPLDSLSRTLLVTEPFDALPICADIEEETGVDLYIPPLPAERGDDSGSSVLSNVQFKVVALSERSGQQLDDAVLRMMMRWEAVKQHIAKQRASDHAHVNTACMYW